jgi:hypothetical protein
MKSSGIICATIGAVAVAGIATTMPAEARGFGPGFAGGMIAGALAAGAVSSAYAYAPGPGYAYPGYAYYGYGPGYYAPYNSAHRAYGVYNESQHGGQPAYGQPYGE